MNAVSPNRFQDPRVLAAEIRNLATQAHQTLHEPLVDLQESRALSQRISDLQVVIDGLASDELSHWLRNLRRRIEPSADESQTNHRLTTSSTG